MSKPPVNEPDFQEAFAPTAGRTSSLWPDSTRAGGAASTGFAHSRFDPMAEDRARLQQQAAAAFDVCHPALALRAVLLVQAALLVAALGTADSLPAWGPQWAVLAFVGVAGTLVWLVAVCAAKTPLHRAAPALRVAVVLALGAAAALLAWLPLWWAGLAGASGGLRVAALLLGGMGFAALLWAWLDLRSRIWHPAHAAARLAELQSRIRPHFLFNALNTALALVRVDPERAETVLEDLAELFRTALADAGASVALEEEIELARRYLAIEQVRFGERLQVQWQIDTRDRRVAQARVPPLVLQPLVENAVRHGVEPSARGGLVRITANVQRGQVVVMVSNTVGDEPGLPGHGMALHNVRERLRLLHDVAAQCDVWREPGLHDPAAISAHGTADALAKPGPDLHGDVFHARVVLPVT